MSRLKTFWNKIGNTGLGVENPVSDNVIRLINQSTFLTVISCLILAAIAFGTGTDSLYASLFLVLAFMFGSIFFLHLFCSLLFVQVYYCLVVPIVFSFSYVLIGGDFAYGTATTITFAITVLLFYKTPRWLWLILAINVAAFASSSIYSDFYPPLLGPIDYPYDAVVVYIICGAWIFILIRKILSERDDLSEQLLHSNREILANKEELEQFTYIASHDLKSPLRSIVGFLSLAKKDLEAGNFESIGQKLEIAINGATEMNTLISDIHDYSRLQNSNESQWSVVDLNEVLSRVKDSLVLDISECNAQISSENLPSLLMERSDLIVIFQNLIQNGIKYNLSKVPTVQISTEQTAQHLLISFKDNGIGIEKQYQEKVFEFFKRLHQRDQYPGSGMGLAIVSKIMLKYHGEVTLKSEPDLGSIFTLQLPLGLVMPRNKKKLLPEQSNILDI